MYLIVIVASRAPGIVPLLYRTEGDVLIPEPIYTAHGSGKTISDYLADRLFEYDRLDKGMVGILAAFIFREAERSATGVGMGTDMVFIHEGNKKLHFITPDAAKEIEAPESSTRPRMFAYCAEVEAQIAQERTGVILLS